MFEAKILKSHEILEALTKNYVYSIFTCSFVPKSINVAHQDLIHNKWPTKVNCTQAVNAKNEGCRLTDTFVVTLNY